MLFQKNKKKTQMNMIKCSYYNQRYSYQQELKCSCVLIFVCLLIWVSMALMSISYKETSIKKINRMNR